MSNRKHSDKLLKKLVELREQEDLTDWDVAQQINAQFKSDLTDVGVRMAYRRHRDRFSTAPKQDKRRVHRSPPKILLLDVETAPIIAHVWGLWDQRVGLNQIVKDTHLLSWTAKWLGEKKLHYMDQRDEPQIENDKELVRVLAAMIDEADIVVTQNGINFDIKVIKARMIINGLKPIAGFRHLDIYREGKKHFRFSSHRLEYLAKALGVEHRKLTVREFDGHELWVQCLKGNIKAWQEMEKYNKLDVIVLEELYYKIRPWVTGLGHEVYTPRTCTCGSTEFVKQGFVYLTAGKYQKYKCTECGRMTRDSTNLLDKEHRRSIKRQI